MEKYPRLFLKAGLIYLAIGTFLGFSYAFNYLEPLRFAHVHLNLFGFVAMFIFGIAYHVLPRFNSMPLKHPELVGLHFYLANIGLIGMVVVYPVHIGIVYSFFLFTGMFSVWLFIYNIYPVLADRQEEAVTEKEKTHEVEEEPARQTAEETITGDMRVRDVLEKHPGTLEIFVEAGLRSLANEEHRANLPPVQIQMAAAKHGLDLDVLLQKLNDFVAGHHEEQPIPGNTLEISKNTLLGDILSAYPETQELLEKEFGSGCFSCPGAKTETLEQAALMHNRDPEALITLLKKEIIHD